jgi:phosphoribosyl 1,2-cyclic phosphate phosphodiesterase
MLHSSASSIKVVLLGTGTSHGVPSIDCMVADYADCPQGVCRAAGYDPRHNRTRCSLLVEAAGGTILIDTSLDFRAQMLAQRVRRIDAVLFTHSHADHIGGLPDIRSYSPPGQPLPIYSSQATITTLRRRFDYIFDPPEIKGGGIPELTAHVVRPGEPFSLCGLDVTPALVEHGSAPECLGYRVGPVAYVPDVKVMPAEAREILRGAEVLILNALRRAPEHPTHLTLDESVALARDLRPRACYFTHMSHDMHYAHDRAGLSGNMDFAYDGLRLEIAAP